MHSVSPYYLKPQNLQFAMTHFLFLIIFFQWSKPSCLHFETISLRFVGHIYILVQYLRILLVLFFKQKLHVKIVMVLKHSYFPSFFL